ncbi:MAG: DUF418 domain-containing protein [Idiomarina sp.]|nr:DUF418 domain-containing protein [Idiomarina sp.]
MASQTSIYSPLPPRIDSLDLLRGIAVLGILLMNIVSMGAPYAVLENPTAAGSFSPLNQFVWAGAYIFAQQKFIAIFAMLFGAGILLMHQSAERRGLAPKPLHFKRMAWLALFGILHAWFLWYGDVLLTYAVAGCCAWMWRYQSALRLAIWGILIYLVPTLLIMSMQVSIGQFDEATLQLISSAWAPSPAEVEQEIAAVQGGLLTLWGERSGLILSLQTDSLIFSSLWLALGYMLIGMALFKGGVMSGKLSTRAYQRLALLAVPGLGISAYSAYFRYQDGFSFEHSMFMPMAWHQPGSLLTAVGYLAIFMLCYQANIAAALQQRLRAVGRLAFSFYIMHSVLAVILFNWIGLFGQLQRFQLILIAMAIWALQLWLGPKYLAHFHQGPLESIWRKLTYGKAGTA